MPKKDHKVSSNGQQGGKSSSVRIKSWDDWFNLCGTLIADLQAYEKLMQEYYFDTQYQNDSDSQHAAQLAYQSKHNKRFFESDRQIPKWMQTKALTSGAVGVVVGLVVAAFLSIIAGMKATGGIAFTGFGWRAIVFGLIFGGLFGYLPIFLHKNKLRKIFSQMRVIEDRISDKITYIPPKYRNSQSVNTFYDLYCSYGIVTFNQAIEACDDYLTSNNLVGAYMAELFDLPYMNGLSADERNGFDKDEALKDPNLPDDIASKTFTGVENADEQLDALIGLSNVKEQIRQMKNRMNFYGSKGTADSISGNHMVFLGPPGTGKTTVARIITRILYDFGYIKENKCVEIDGGYLKSPYSGQTTERANAIIKYALGGVLLIDEAYILTEDKNGSQGAEAVGVLLKAMEDHKNDFVCILAGYEDNMNRMLASNEGFQSRIKYKIYFENFTVDEMGEIFRQLMKTGSSHRYKIEKEAFETLKQHFARERRIAGFGNARVVRTAWDSILDVHADRYMRKEVDEEHKFVITKEDIEQYTEVRRKQMVEDGRNFIASRNLDSTVISLTELKQKTKPGSEDPDKDLAALTGLNVVKDEIKRMKAQFAFYDGNLENNGYHMVFLGPPGTGKTTVAGIMTGYLYQMGLIQENSYVDINGDFLRGMYLGHTGKRTEAVVQYAQGMVLFVDEAYLLTSSGGQSDSFGQEAVGVLIDAMEKYRHNFVVIFAGYEKEMSDFLDMNSGLRSRINLEFHFESYTPHELAGMFRNVAKNEGFTVVKDVWVPMQRYFKDKVADPKFGNGRFIRQFFESMKKQHILNFADGMYSADEKYVFTLDDLKSVIDADTTLTESMPYNESANGSVYGGEGGNDIV